MRQRLVRRLRKSLKSLSMIYQHYKNRPLYEEKNSQKAAPQRSSQAPSQEIGLATDSSAVHRPIIDHQMD